MAGKRQDFYEVVTSSTPPLRRQKLTFFEDVASFWAECKPMVLRSAGLNQLMLGVMQRLISSADSLAAFMDAHHLLAIQYGQVYNKPVQLCIYTYAHTHKHVYTHTHTERERARER